MRDGIFSQILDAAVAAPVTIGLTMLGAIVTVAQALLTAIDGLAPDLGSTRPRHNAVRVREQLEAARRTAQASGVLWPKVPDRSSRDC